MRFDQLTDEFMEGNSVLEITQTEPFDRVLFQQLLASNGITDPLDIEWLESLVEQESQKHNADFVVIISQEIPPVFTGMIRIGRGNITVYSDSKQPKLCITNRTKISRD